MTTTIARRRGPKEKTTEQLAIEHAKSGRDVHPALTSPTLPIGIAARQLTTPPKTMSDADLRQRLDQLWKLYDVPAEDGVRAKELAMTVVWRKKHRAEAEDFVDRFGHLLRKASNGSAAESSTEELRATLDAIWKCPDVKDHAALIRIGDLIGRYEWNEDDRTEAVGFIDRYSHLLAKPETGQEEARKRAKAKRAEAKAASNGEGDVAAGEASAALSQPENSHAVSQDRPHKANGKHPPAAAELPVMTGAPIEIALELCHEHPENRDSKDSDPDIAELAESIKVDDLLQPIMVRVAPPHWKLPKGHFQIVFGERRWRASRVAGRGQVRAYVRTDLDDATTRRLIVTENAKRKDLNSIQRAQLIETLCSPNKDGTPGMTREQAAKEIGLQDGASASNLVKLLKLPQVWQDRVAAGELPESFARLIVPVLELAPVMEELEKDWKTRDKRRNSWDDNAFDSRQVLEASIENLIDGECRCEYPDRKGQKPEIDTSNPEIAKQLGVVEMQLPTGGNRKLERVHVVTDVKAYDQMRQKIHERKAKRQAASVGRDESPKKAEKRELSPAEKKQKATERTKLLNGRLADWRHKLLRRALIQLIDYGADNGLRLVLAYAASPSYRGPTIADALKKTTGKSQSGGGGYGRGHYWPAVVAMKDGKQAAAVLSGMAKQLLADESTDWRMPTLPHALVEGLAADLKVNVEAAWEQLQSTVDAKLTGEALLEELFLLHQTEELKSLAKELGVQSPKANPTRGDLIALLLAIPRGTKLRLPLPKCIKPVAGGKSKSAKTKKR